MTDGRKWGDGFAYDGDSYDRCGRTVTVSGRRHAIAGERITECGPGWADYNWHRDDRPPAGTVHGPSGWVRGNYAWLDPHSKEWAWVTHSGHLDGEVAGCGSEMADTINEALAIYRRHTEGYGIDERPEDGTVCPVTGMNYDGMADSWGHNGGWWNRYDGEVYNNDAECLGTAANTVEAMRLIESARKDRAAMDKVKREAEARDHDTVSVAHLVPEHVWRTDPPTADDVGHVWFKVGDHPPIAALVKAAKVSVWVVTNADDAPWTNGVHRVHATGGNWPKGASWTPANTTPPPYEDQATRLGRELAGQDAETIAARLREVLNG